MVTPYVRTDSEVEVIQATQAAGEAAVGAGGGKLPYSLPYESYPKKATRQEAILLEQAQMSRALMPFKSASGDMELGITAGKWLNGDAEVSFAEADVTLTDANGPNYVYMTAAGVATVAAAWPVPSVTPHIPIAIVTCAAGAYTCSNIDSTDRTKAFLAIGGAAAGSLNLLDWQESLLDELDFTAAEPAGPALGDRYLNTGTGASSVTAQGVTANHIYEWNDTNWTDITPTEGACALVEDRDMLIAWNAAAWVDIGTFALLNEAQTFFAASDISGAEAETLTDTSNADALHDHTLDAGVSDVAATAAEVNVLAKRTAILAFGYVDFAGRPADADLLTIDGRKYEYDSNASFPDAGGDVIIDANIAANIDDDITACAAAINGDGSATVDAIADAANDILWLYAKTAGVAGNALTLVSALANTTASGGNLTDGADAAVAVVWPLRHTLTAQEIVEGVLRFDTGLTTIESLQVLIEDAGGLMTHLTATATVAAGIITITEGGAWGAGDILNIVAVGTE